MDPANFSQLHTWLTEAGLAGKSETALLDGFCRCALVAGLPIARAAIIIDTLHPVHEGRAFLWRSEAGQTQTELVEYGPTSEGETAENWRRSVFFHLLQTGGSLFRTRFHAGETADFFNFARMRDEGMTDVAAMITRFSLSGAIGEMDSLYSYWATDRPRRRACGGDCRLGADAGARGEMPVARAHRGDVPVGGAQRAALSGFRRRHGKPVAAQRKRHRRAVELSTW